MHQVPWWQIFRPIFNLIVAPYNRRNTVDFSRFQDKGIHCRGDRYPGIAAKLCVYKISRNSSVINAATAGDGFQDDTLLNALELCKFDNEFYVSIVHLVTFPLSIKEVLIRYGFEVHSHISDPMNLPHQSRGLEGACGDGLGHYILA